MQPLGNCPGCGGDEPFEQVHADAPCPDVGGECPEWLCPACGAGVVMGGIFSGSTVPPGSTIPPGSTVNGAPVAAGEGAEAAARQAVRAA